jgi:hypothetical protein
MYLYIEKYAIYLPYCVYIYIVYILYIRTVYIYIVFKHIYTMEIGYS